ncbi:hypothetical protein FGIG_10889 [Fasciola gigantica]|uniref:Uncharacterized protein n=1 Tax=Fasciola gigantica TaxID=46835 RepID=A0A504YBB8_FASGI|nr:hypothetical protein FGIG_10889 [Fasciola gigantica]
MNPFGDDDEDFQTSSILDYNLEVSFRSVYMDPRSFPDNMSMPLGKHNQNDKPDDLPAFLEQIDCDLNKQCDQITEYNVSNLEMHPSPFSRCGKMFCCDRANTPSVPSASQN